MRDAEVQAGPIVKWAGGKRSLLPELLARAPTKFKRYLEPFAGGAAMFFALNPEHSVLGDINTDLIATYEAIKADPEPVIARLRRSALTHSPDFYYRTRDRWNDERGAWCKAAVASTFLYLNRAGFNGLFRVNRAGRFNVPFGRNAKSSLCNPRGLRAAHVALVRAELRAGDYRKTLDDVERDDFVYIDSPHVPRSETSSFTAYTSVSFGLDDQRELAEVARQLASRGVHVMLSNADTPFVRALYKGFRIERVACPRAINADASNRGDVRELIIVGDPGARRRRQ